VHVVLIFVFVRRRLTACSLFDIICGKCNTNVVSLTTVFSTISLREEFKIKSTYIVDQTMPYIEIFGDFAVESLPLSFTVLHIKMTLKQSN